MPPEWEEALQLQQDGTTYRTVIRSVNKGGAVVDVGPLRGFVPLSKMDPARLPRNAQNGGNGAGAGCNGLAPKDLAHLVGKPIAAKIIQVNVLEGKLVLSERAAMMEAVAAALNPGDVVEGVVTRLADYGAFVSLRSPDGELHGVEGLIHISELSWSMVLTPDAVVQPGSLVRCKVKRVDREKSQIQLSLKDMEGDPLRETLDGLLSADAPAPAAASAPLPAAIEAVCQALAEEPGITDVGLGRQVEEKRAVSQDLELWMGREGVEGGYNLLARAGRLVQEILVSTSLGADDMKATIQRVLRKLV
ncbi:hypothetical protein WJX81_007126 [Elliptochloris bilobata]|uniref:S1 motif domain-containing protein n=1 Tax=Elliptochloris bilobata TaxID=381761 RepID=A0AAW1RPU9_9CHLO